MFSQLKGGPLPQQVEALSAHIYVGTVLCVSVCVCGRMCVCVFVSVCLNYAKMAAFPVCAAQDFRKFSEHMQNNG